MTTAANTAAASSVPHAGLPLAIGGITYIVPPMSVRTARQYWPLIERMQGQGDNPLPVIDQMELTAELLHQALLRNYPALDPGVVFDYLDVENYGEAGAMVFGRGAWLRWVEAQAMLSGNWGALQPVPQPATAAGGTGEPSALPSSPAPAGDTAMSTS